MRPSWPCSRPPSCSPHRPTRPSPPPRPAGALLAAFDSHAIVAKSSPDVGTFVFDLVRDPRFPGRANDIAVECGNSRLQPLLDAYIAGGDVPEISRVWRDTTQPSCGFSTYYEQLFALVRQVNKTLPAEQEDPGAGLRSADRLEPACGPRQTWNRSTTGTRRSCRW